MHVGQGEQCGECSIWVAGAEGGRGAACRGDQDLVVDRPSEGGVITAQEAVTDSPGSLLQHYVDNIPFIVEDGCMTTDQQFPPADDPVRERAQREYIGLFHIAERHGDTPERRARQAHPEMLEPYGAAKIVAGLAGGGFVTHPDEHAVDDTDIMAALTLMPKLRLEIDELEIMLLLAARRSGITWQHIASGLGLGSAQAARQRYDRLAQRTSSADGDVGDGDGAEPGGPTGTGG
ncbi:hypothetical protein O4159_21230 [Gordonia terrae]|nr:hypothetical protein [Gordonia terrae]